MATEAQPSDARERILDSGYALLTRGRVHEIELTDVGERAGVSREDVDRHFADKEDLLLAVLAQREQLWTLGFVELEARRRAVSPEGRLLAIFDAFDEWFHRPDFEACTFINVLVELGREHPAGAASVEYLGNIRGVIRTLAEEAGLRDTEEFARSWHILMKGSIVSAAEGDVDAAQRAKNLAQLLLDQHR